LGLHADPRCTANLGHQVGRGTIANILKENGINPVPERDAHTRWSTFLKAHRECLTTTDFLSVEVLTIKGRVTHYVLFFIDIASRSVHVAGITAHPDSSWMAQIARNITDVNEGFLRGGRYLILDRDAKYTAGFRHTLTREGIRLIRLPAQSPNLGDAKRTMPSRSGRFCAGAGTISAPSTARQERTTYTGVGGV
jgi:putative transposase